ncbi:MAG: sigma factor-like helix-turn-helix DNA-binding protein [Patescibacteria group bacterium]|nr:sigma factor-like helix-turn-helix DNA-binding protein [Patescibacteria group bacterium]MDD4610845.1 sigma factor-like helix-turn-helix DNA-binding protein [Patescibacteria group bacterium]
MDNFSILDQIISNQKAEEIAKLNAIEIINNLFGELSQRERDILTRRFGLHGNGYETLENVGSLHGLTRERIRQIESASIKKLHKLDNFQTYLDTLKKVISQLLEEHGGIMERDYLLDALVSFSLDSEGAHSQDAKAEEIHKNHLEFLITKLLHNDFEEVANTAKFKRSYKLKYQTLEHFEELLAELIEKIKEIKTTLKTTEIINLILKLESYKKYEDKLNRIYSLDVSRILSNELFDEDYDFINKNKTLYSLLKSAKSIEQNKFGHWGISTSREIKPKTINDKIFLIMKHKGKPMHFSDIAEEINKTNFDGKTANAATVHNELILDDKYVLIGRGIYSLKEWGYEKGTVAEVIREILSQSDKSLSKEEIIRKVLEKRLVKETTIILALMNKDLFDKAGDRYQLKNTN